MKKIIIFWTLVLALASCKDFLNPKQVDLIYNEVFWSSQVDAEVGLSGVYALYRGLMASAENWYSRADATTGFIKAGWNGGSSSRLYSLGVFNDIKDPNKMWGSLDGMADWSNFYKVVAQANLVIDKVEDMPESVFKSGEKQRILGEAYFLRGLVYFNIVRIWGNAPYITEMIESSTQVINEDLSPVLIPRTDDYVICAGVLADAQKAVDMLEFDTQASSRWGIFANKGAALALSAHANMWMNFLARRDRSDRDDDPNQYADAAIEALEELRRDGGYSYVDYSVEGAVKTLYTTACSEAVFYLNIDPDANESYRADRGGVTSLTCKMVPYDGDSTKDRATQIDFVPFSQKSNMYPDYNFINGTGDIRPNLFFGAWDSEYNEPVNDVQNSVTSDRTKVTWLKKYAFFMEDSYRDWDEYIAYFACAKIPVFRYTDVMLLLAEAYARRNKADKSVAIINEIRSRAKIGNYSGDTGTSSLLEEVMQQRISELFGEGHLYFDMVRMNLFANEHLMGAAKYRQKGYYWPVSSSILSTNTLISQTPYWSGKTQW